MAIGDFPVRLGNAGQVSRSTKSQLHGDGSPADSTLDSILFVRHYSGPPSWFLLLRIVICLSSPGTLLPSDATVRNLSFAAMVRRSFGASTADVKPPHASRTSSSALSSTDVRCSDDPRQAAIDVPSSSPCVDCLSNVLVVGPIGPLSWSASPFQYSMCCDSRAAAVPRPRSNPGANLSTGASARRDWPATSTGRRTFNKRQQCPSCRGRATAIYFVVRWWFSESARGQPTTL